MPNPYYDHTTYPSANSRASSAALQNEFAAVEAGFDAVDAAKADVAGETYTGTHNFTGATVRVATPVVSADAATKGYADQLSMQSGNMPPGGATGQILRKTSSTDYLTEWVTQTGVGGATSSGSVVLTAASSSAQSITTTGYGQSVTLPDATTCLEAGNLFSIANAGEFDLRVLDNSGTLLGFIRGYSASLVGCADNSTAAGVWVLSNAELLGVSAKHTHHSYNGANNVTDVKYVSLDSDRDFFVYGDTSRYGVIHNKTTNTWGSPVLIRGSMASGFVSAIKSATDQVLVVSCNTTTAFEAVCVTTSGTTISAVGTAATATLLGNIVEIDSLIQVGSSFLVHYYRDTTAHGIRAMSISGTTVTIGAETTLTGASNEVAVSYPAGGDVAISFSSNGSTMYIKAHTITGSSISAGTQVSTACDVTPAIYPFGSAWFVSYLNTSHYVGIVSISGTVPVINSIVSGLVGQVRNLLVVGSKVVCASYNSSTVEVNTFTNNAGTPVAATEVSTVLNTAPSALALVPASSTGCRVIASSTGAKQCMTIDVSGANPVITAVSAVSHASGAVGSPASYISDGGISQHGIYSSKFHCIYADIDQPLIFYGNEIIYKDPITTMYIAGDNARISETKTALASARIRASHEIYIIEGVA